MKSAHFQNFLSLLWGWFLIWSVLAAGVVFFSVGQGVLGSGPLGQAADLILKYLDLVWVLLAFANLYLFSVRESGATSARLYLFGLLGGVALLLGVGVATGVPFGPLRFSELLGVRFFQQIPVGVFFLWYVIVLSSAYTARWWLDGRGGVAGQAFATGALTLGTDLALESVAWKVRFYWLWHPLDQAAAWPPLPAYFVWGATGALFGWFFARRGGISCNGMPQATVILLALNAFLWLALTGAQLHTPAPRTTLEAAPVELIGN